MYIERFIYEDILKRLEANKAIIIYGPRRVGKTTLIQEISENLTKSGQRPVIYSGDNLSVQAYLSSQSIDKLKTFIGKTEILIIDEAQKIEKIGLNLKIIVDHLPGIKVIATGSSSFELANQVGEPLVGRKWQYYLFPIAQMELNRYENPVETADKLEERLIFGGYPEIVTAKSRSQKVESLEAITDSHLFKDILVLERLRKSRKLIQLLKLLAFQIGQEVSLRELSNSLDINIATVDRYLDLLEKVFIIKNVTGFSRNLRKEVTRTSRYYFYDNGIRNSIINNFNPIDTRNDIGQLWENYLFMERLKKKHYLKIYANNYFWRTYDQKELDLVEERDGKLYGFEFKWKKSRFKPPRDWLETYREASYQVINKDNYLDFIT